MLVTNLLNPTPARALISKFYYQLPNNGSQNEGLLSCNVRYKEAITCAIICVEQIIESRQDDGNFDDRLSATVNEYYTPHPMYLTYWLDIEKELIQIEKNEQDKTN